ncbi:pantetheine-phosphate adenylyltransferase [Verrucomicrobia bacterium]|nr:pantetheine-phosphate adenylyltransferase [Verrucomicrobiota bacterium]
MKRAVYAGSFDPLTFGHLWMIEEGRKLFDELIVALGINPAKDYTFSVDQRMEVLRSTIGEQENVRVDEFKNKYLVQYAKEQGAQFILRGIRTEGDYSYERQMRHINGDLQPEITTLFLIPPREIAEVSSSFVKGLVGPVGWENVITEYVPAPVNKMLLEKFSDYHKPGA